MFGFGKSKQLEQDLNSARETISSLQSEVTQIKNEMPSWGNLSPAQWSEFFTFATSSSGVIVTPDSAKRSAAVYACTRLIAGSVSVLTIRMYRRNANGSRTVENSPLNWLLNESPYPTLTAVSFWEWMISSMLLRRDGIAQIIRDNKAQPKYFMPLPRDCVVIKKQGDELIYLVNDGIKKYGLSQDDVLHFPGYGFNGIEGESVIQYAARQAIGTSLSADEFSGELFANGAVPSAVIQYPQGVKLDKEQQSLLQTSLENSHAGAGNRHKPIILQNGGTLQAVSMTAEDAQLLEARKFQVIEIARAFGVPPHMIGETSSSTSWGTGIEQISLGYVRYTLGPHLARIEQELNRKLWPRSQQFFLEFDRDSMLAGDSKTESEFFSKALGGPGTQGYMTVNEVRAKKNMPPVEGGEKLIFAGSDKTPAKQSQQQSEPTDEPQTTNP